MNPMETRFVKYLALTFVLTALFTPSLGFAEPVTLQVEDAAICVDVVDLQCQGQDVQFSSQLGKLYCFTRIVGAKEPTSITHVWYYGEKQRARVVLNVNSHNWRTYSSKIIQVHEIGDWHVDILGPGEELLHTIHFKVVP